MLIEYVFVGSIIILGNVIDVVSLGDVSDSIVEGGVVI